MNKRILTGLAMAAVIFLLNAGVVFPASTVNFSESYTEKILTYREDGETWYEEYASGKFSATFKLDLNSIFSTSKTDNMTKQFNGDTCFEIVLASTGSVEEWFCLGDGGDVAYAPGKTSATVKRTEDIGETTEKWVTYLTTTLRWTAKNALTITITGLSEWAGWALADYYDGETNPAIEDVIWAWVTVSGAFKDKKGDAITEFYAYSDDADIPMKGKATTKIVAKGSGDYREEFELTTVNLTGKGTMIVGYEDGGGKFTRDLNRLRF